MNSNNFSLLSPRRSTNSRPHIHITGRVTGIRGPLVVAKIPRCPIGDLCTIHSDRAGAVQAQVVSFEEEVVSLAPFDGTNGIAPGDRIIHESMEPTILVGDHLIGSVIDPLGNPLRASNTKHIHLGTPQPIFRRSPPPLSRVKIDTPISTGVRAIDALCTLGVGQRVGLFAGSGVGKSTLLGMLARGVKADVVVVSLVGERGREVLDFVTESLADGLHRSVVVVATSDDTPIRRKLAPFSATTIAENFRDQGKDVLLLVDSLTRTARAIRDVGLSAGEVPVRHGYTPSVYEELPKLIERAGKASKGSITSIYTVLTNGERDIDPLAEEVKSLLDGHIMLDRRIAESGRWPAIDVTNSISRLFSELHSIDYQREVSRIRQMISRLNRDRDILAFGGTPDPELSAFISCEPELHTLLNQAQEVTVPYENSLMAARELSLLLPKSL